MSPVDLAESAQAKPEGKGIWRVCLIGGDVHGSSGYYPAEVLERDGPSAFPRGTHVFLDHATPEEEDQRPEGSVKDLAAVLLEDAHYEDGRDGKGLFARMQVFPDHFERVSAWAEHDCVGMSIRALGNFQVEESTGRKVITEIIHGKSVDIVTRAGAGGRLIEMTESAREGGGEKQIFASLSEADKRGMQALYESMQGLSAKVEQLQAELAEAKKAEEPEGMTPGELFAKLNDSGLPGILAKRIADRYTPGMDVDAEINDAKALVDEVSSAAEPVADGAPNDAENASGAEPEGEPAMSESFSYTDYTKNSRSTPGYVVESGNENSGFASTLDELYGV